MYNMHNVPITLFLYPFIIYGIPAILFFLTN
jgi:hypothetical protein